MDGRYDIARYSIIYYAICYSALYYANVRPSVCLSVTGGSVNKTAVLSQGEPRDAALNFDTYRILQ